MTGLEELDEADIEDAIRRELEALDNLDLKNFEEFSDPKYEDTKTETFDKVGICCMLSVKNVVIYRLCS